MEDTLQQLNLTHLYWHMGVTFICWILVVVAVLVDLSDGVYTARVLNVPIRSHKLRITINKCLEYYRLLILGFILDCFGLMFPQYSMPYVTIVMSVGLVLVEGKSMYEHLKRRKSATVELKDLLGAIISAASERDAKAVMREIGRYISDGVEDKK